MLSNGLSTIEKCLLKQTYDDITYADNNYSIDDYPFEARNIVVDHKILHYKIPPYLAETEYVKCYDNTKIYFKYDNDIIDKYKYFEIDFILPIIETTDKLYILQSYNDAIYVDNGYQSTVANSSYVSMYIQNGYITFNNYSYYTIDTTIQNHIIFTSYYDKDASKYRFKCIINDVEQKIENDNISNHKFTKNLHVSQNIDLHNIKLFDTNDKAICNIVPAIDTVNGYVLLYDTIGDIIHIIYATNSSDSINYGLLDNPSVVGDFKYKDNLCYNASGNLTKNNVYKSMKEPKHFTKLKFSNYGNNVGTYENNQWNVIVYGNNTIQEFNKLCYTSFQYDGGTNISHRCPIYRIVGDISDDYNYPTDSTLTANYNNQTVTGNILHGIPNAIYKSNITSPTVTYDKDHCIIHGYFWCNQGLYLNNNPERPTYFIVDNFIQIEGLCINSDNYDENNFKYKITNKYNNDVYYIDYNPNRNNTQYTYITYDAETIGVFTNNNNVKYKHIRIKITINGLSTTFTFNNTNVNQTQTSNTIREIATPTYNNSEYDDTPFFPDVYNYNYNKQPTDKVGVNGDVFLGVNSIVVFDKTDNDFKQKLLPFSLNNGYTYSYEAVGLIDIISHTFVNYHKTFYNGKEPYHIDNSIMYFGSLVSIPNPKYD